MIQNPKHVSVESNKIAPFPYDITDYKPGDKILALWHDEESDLWTTVFYPATVVEKKNSNQLAILYEGSEKLVVIDTSKVTKFPHGFNPHGFNPQSEKKKKNEFKMP